MEKRQEPLLPKHIESTSFVPPLIEFKPGIAHYHILGFSPDSTERTGLDAQIETLGKILHSPEGVICSGLLERRRLLDEVVLNQKPEIERENQRIEALMRERFMLMKNREQPKPGVPNPLLDFIKKHPDWADYGDWTVHFQNQPFQVDYLQLAIRNPPITDNPWCEDDPGWGKILRVFRNLLLEDNLRTVGLPENATPKQCSDVKRVVDTTHPKVQVVRFKHP
ncbi:MAG: hypothetical protein ABH851_00580 [Methanobacteriota archaeon]